MIFIEFALTEKDHKKQHLCGTFLALSMLKKYTGFYLSSEDIITGEFGKPYFKGIEGVDFSVSHSDTVVMCAMCVNGETKSSNALPFPEDGRLCIQNAYFIESASLSPEIGADIELVDESKTEEKLCALAERYFHTEENNFIKRTPSIPYGILEDPLPKKDGFSREKFYSVWTKKEAFGKMMGTGLKGILKGFDVTSQISCPIFSFSLENCGDNFIGAVCFKP